MFRDTSPPTPSLLANPSPSCPHLSLSPSPSPGPHPAPPSLPRPLPSLPCSSPSLSTSLQTTPSPTVVLFSLLRGCVFSRSSNVSKMMVSALMDLTLLGNDCFLTGLGRRVVSVGVVLGIMGLIEVAMRR